MTTVAPPAGGSTHSSRAFRLGLAVLSAGCGLLAGTASAGAQTAAGGAGGAAFGAPVLQSFSCRSACAASTGIRPGGLLRINGSSLAHVTRVVFLGRAGTADDKAAAALHVTDARVDVRVPEGAHSGTLRAVSDTGIASPPTAAQIGVGEPAPLSDGAPAPVPTADGYAFPVVGPFTFGEGFGVARAGHTHEGQDVLAGCGLPLVAARGGTVKFNATQANAGNYLVIAADDGADMVYMHLRERSPLRKGDTVTTGEQVGIVGRTGDATVCHLHFELWTSPGWYSGGHPIDPLPSLRVWAKDAKSAAKSQA